VRGGRIGGLELFRGGGRGGRTGDLVGGSGLRGAGWLPKCLAEVGALVRIGGLLTVWTRGGIGGLCPGGGGGGGALAFAVVA
jgi:hypothetical protein